MPTDLSDKIGCNALKQIIQLLHFSSQVIEFDMKISLSIPREIEHRDR